MCDRAMWLDHGIAKRIGPAGEVIDAYLAGVHHVEVDRPGGTQWGSAEARFTGVELLGPDGLAATQLRTGDPATFRLRWESEEPVPRPVFCLAISTVDGVLVSAPTSRSRSLDLDVMVGSGAVDVAVSSIFSSCPVPTRSRCRSGIERCSTSSTTGNVALHFDVVAGRSPERGAGVLALGAGWQAVTDGTEGLAAGAGAS